MNIQLISYTPNAKGIIYLAYKQCYSNDEDMNDLVSSVTEFEVPDNADKLISHGVKAGHHSPLEHVSFTFRATDVSRSLTHQLVRHRIASYNQMSQRYVDMTDNGFVAPSKILNNAKAKWVFSDCMNYIQRSYEEIQNLLIADGYTKEQANEEARYVLPNASKTSIIFTMNCRTLLHFFEERCCFRAQEEIRNMAYLMLERCLDILPSVFIGAGPKCKKLGHCPEMKGCGMFDSKEK